ncbi:MAG: hypothetical protein NTV11_16575 [Rhodocyclales bacterium]|nr:hypothetical protein [Rhodocyclales bacterium]
MSDSDTERRRLWCQHWKEFSRLHARYEVEDVDYRLREYPSFPEEARSLICGAKSKRTGQPCKRRDISGSNGRCKFHGGASTGPTTKAGKRKSARNGKKGGRPRKNQSR